ncbi:MAG: DUF599 domain-containing protein [Thiobacillaceae bacterium]
MNNSPFYLTDLLVFIASVALVMAYHLVLRARTRRQPDYAVHLFNSVIRQHWAEGVMRNPDVLGVQTLRNSTMAASFMASTAVLLTMGVLSLTSQADKLAQTWHALSFMGSAHTSLWIGKMIVLVIDLLAAFFCFTVSVRFFNHVGYMVTMPIDARPPHLTPELAGRYLNRAGNYFSLGTRIFYFTIPLLFWLFGSPYLLFSTAGLLGALYFLDRSP